LKDLGPVQAGRGLLRDRAGRIIRSLRSDRTAKKPVRQRKA
jgi:hypothetical protein